ncbi:MAG: Dolichol-phosphate mannose synthase [Candidatus Gottesmanbacteria bacterium GW2011_GWC2_39_8]|uniref:Dolichol-phosphate mannose synthase n=1 Tax=Candidatus Gottesmanbacteria bacterium GW2011_GWC2_39_8 TaxID=1618450 RepID=A0A0G0Q2E8_9BACT|nr:MAG: Dolichol-phosphate mannose synthase [Candidatus Gottesmanbacteria bacterium GW2011_GWC2_39_8]
MKTCIILPAYNEAQRIGKVISELSKAKRDIIVVDDGSEDQTTSVAKKQKVTVIRHEVNLGKGAALTTGIYYAMKKGYQAVVFADADGQHAVEDVGRIVEEVDKYKFIIGQRETSGEMPFLRKIGNSVASVLFKILFRTDIPDPLSGLRAFHMDIYPIISWESRGYEVEVEMVVNAIKNNIPITNIPIKTVYLDKYKGITFLSAYKILIYMLKWKLNS